MSFVPGAKFALRLAVWSFTPLLVFPPFCLNAEPDRRNRAGQDEAAIVFEAVSHSKEFPGAAAPGALQYACSKNTAVLEGFFREQSVPFNPDLTRKKKGFICHIFYRPTVPGFRAHAESDPVTGVVFGVESRSFLARRSHDIGDSLDVAKTIVRLSSSSIGAVVNTRTEAPGRLSRAAARHHFASDARRVRILPTLAGQENVWAQDYVKSGESGGQEWVLLPRMAFESSPENGPLFSPLLDALEQSRWVRSQLSWEGGDLLVARHPQKPGRSILFYGDAAQPYWAKTLSAGEYAHVLKTEFGADEAVHAGDIATHADYVLNFLPDGQTVLLARPMHGNFALSREALGLLIRTHGNVPVLQEIRLHHDTGHPTAGDQREQLLQLLEQAAREHLEWPRPVDMGTWERAEAYARQHCDGDLASCLTGPRLERMLTNDAQLASDWVSAVSDLRLHDVSSNALIGIVASQAALPEGTIERRLNHLKQRLQELGFRVVETPSIAGTPGAMVRWAGISYTNFVAVENKIFMPVFGLGPAEDQIVADIQSQLPTPYRIVPVYARHVLASNGGIHCVAGILRSAAPRKPEGTPATYPPEAPMPWEERQPLSER